MSKISPLLLFLFILNACSTNKTLYVTNHCKDNTKIPCLQIKENVNAHWTPFNNKIEGFEYKEGYTYKIEVESSKKDTLHYKLLKLIYKEKNKSSKITLSFDGKWKVVKLIGIDSLHKSPTLQIDLNTQKIYGRAGCNKYSTSFTLDSNSISFGIPLATKMYCTNMPIEKAFFDCLQNTSKYKFVNGNLLFFSKDDKEQMICTKIRN